MQQRRIQLCGALAYVACLHGMAYGRGTDAADAVRYATGPAAAPVAASVVPVSAAQFAPEPGPIPEPLTRRLVPAGQAPPLSVAPVVPGSDDGGAPFDASGVAAERLAQLRGGTDTVWNDMKLSGAVTGNTAINVVTGVNTITNGSFSNASGLPVAIQNSGANVLIQNATIINVQLH
jgi:hypothetical protein